MFYNKICISVYLYLGMTTLWDVVVLLTGSGGEGNLTPPSFSRIDLKRGNQQLSLICQKHCYYSNLNNHFQTWAQGQGCHTHCLQVLETGSSSVVRAQVGKIWPMWLIWMALAHGSPEPWNYPVSSMNGEHPKISLSVPFSWSILKDIFSGQQEGSAYLATHLRPIQVMGPQITL